MNPDHAQLCSSEEWAMHIRDDVLPLAIGDRDLGRHVLEIGPGYGAATRWIASMVDQLTTIELDQQLATDLEKELPTVSIVRGSGTSMPFDDASFTAAVSFTMLHHVPTHEGQDMIFSEIVRVLRRDGIFVDSDSLASPSLAEFHRDDTYNPIDPEGLEDRLIVAGFSDAEVAVYGDEGLLTFVARR